MQCQVPEFKGIGVLKWTPDLQSLSINYYPVLLCWFQLEEPLPQLIES